MKPCFPLPAKLSPWTILPSSPSSFPPKRPARRIFGVRELVTSVRTHLEKGFPDVWVEGEISNYRPAESGHHLPHPQGRRLPAPRRHVPRPGAPAALPSAERDAGHHPRPRHHVRGSRRDAVARRIHGADGRRSPAGRLRAAQGQARCRGTLCPGAQEAAARCCPGASASSPRRAAPSFETFSTSSPAATSRSTCSSIPPRCREPGPPPKSPPEFASLTRTRRSGTRRREIAGRLRRRCHPHRPRRRQRRRPRRLQR